MSMEIPRLGTQTDFYQTFMSFKLRVKYKYIIYLYHL